MFRYIWFIIILVLKTGIVLIVKVCLNYKKCTIQYTSMQTDPSTVVIQIVIKTFCVYVGELISHFL